MFIRVIIACSDKCDQKYFLGHMMQTFSKSGYGGDELNVAKENLYRLTLRGGGQADFDFRVF